MLSIEQEVAKLLKVSTARVSQIKESALSKLREKLKDMIRYIQV
jgi:RNA polymerase sigma factor for flagellar operon FliA